MTEPNTILVIHPMAIGDVVLGTPVAAALKHAFPQSKVIYFTHSSLLPLLRLCHAIDEYIEWIRKASLLEQLRTIKRIRPDLIVDLTSSTRTRLLCLLSGTRYVRYRKQPRSQRPVEHVSIRYMQTLSGIIATPIETVQLFPTLEPQAHNIDKVQMSIENEDGEKRPLLALIPGVGGLRPNRAWPEDNWIALTHRLAETHLVRLVLIGGPDEIELCAKIQDAASSLHCRNFAGKLSLPETAALLKLADLAVSGDTGPCHIAVGVGTPVVSMMGPTLPARSGPYGNETLGFDVSSNCKCTTAKTCTIRQSGGAGECMESILPESVFERITSVLKNSDAQRKRSSVV
jgi:heptosyltransferase I